MKEIDLGKEVIFNVKLGEKEFKLTEPTVLQIEKFRKGIDENKDNVVEHSMNLIVELGMPKEVVESLGATKLNLLLTGLMDGLEKK
jgi:hypothetical protein